MILAELTANYRKVRRASTVVATFFKYRLGSLLPQRFATSFRLVDLTKGNGIAALPLAHRFRLALEELGPTFIKLGQMLSVRPDLVPQEFVDELRYLQDHGTPLSTQEVEGVLAAEWSDRAAGIFQSFDVEPIAVASLSQVHRAVLKNGDEVAVKIQKPNIRDLIDSDVELLREFASYWEGHRPGAWVYQPQLMVDEFGRVIVKELDFLNEAQNYERFRRNFQNTPGVKIPKVYWELTTPRVLVMEYIAGVRITDITKPVYDGMFDRRVVVERGILLFLKGVFEDGFFHADPHPGNIFVLPGNIIAVLDVGMVGWLDEKTMLAALRFFGGFTSKNIQQMTRALEELGMKHEEFDREALALDLREFVSRYHGLPLHHLRLEVLFSDLIEIFVRYQFVIPRNVVLVLKALGTIEGIGKEVNPDFNFFEYARPFFQRVMQDRFSLRSLWHRFDEVFHETVHALTSIPQELYQLLQRISDGRFRVLFELHGFQDLLRLMDRSVNRLSFSILIASFMLSWALIIRNSTIADFMSVLGIIGFAIAVIWAVWLIVAIFRSHKY